MSRRFSALELAIGADRPLNAGYMANRFGLKSVEEVKPVARSSFNPIPLAPLKQKPVAVAVVAAPSKNAPSSKDPVFNPIPISSKPRPVGAQLSQTTANQANQGLAATNESDVPPTENSDAPQGRCSLCHHHRQPSNGANASSNT